MSGQGSSPDESFSTLAAGCTLRESRTEQASAAGISSGDEHPSTSGESSNHRDESSGINSISGNNNTNTASGGSSSEHAADFFHNYYSTRGYALDTSTSTEPYTSTGESRSERQNIYGELTVYSWGRGEDGQLGIGDTSDQDEPTYVDALRGVGVKEIACGSGHTVVLTGEGEVYTW